MGLGVAVASVALGAAVIEKHFTLSRKDGGVASAFSSEPQEMKSLVDETQKAWQALGKISYAKLAKRKIICNLDDRCMVGEDMKAGERFTQKNLRIIRPGFGIAPRYYEVFLGKK